MANLKQSLLSFKNDPNTETDDYIAKKLVDSAVFSDRLSTVAGAFVSLISSGLIVWVTLAQVSDAAKGLAISALTLMGGGTAISGVTTRPKILDGSK